MVTYVLDASALLRSLDREAGCHRIDQLLDEHADQRAEAIIPAVQWGEIIGILKKRTGTSQAAVAQARGLGLRIVPVEGLRAENAISLKAAFGLSYMDAFAAELASDSLDHILVTADYDFKPADSHIRIEFLPAKPRP